MTAEAAGAVPDDPTLRVMASEYAISEGARKARENASAGAVPDDVIELLARALHEGWRGPGGFDADLDADQFREEARSLASVPSVAEVFARDAKVREIVEETTADMADESEQPMSYTAADGFDSIAALYSEDGAR